MSWGVVRGKANFVRVCIISVRSLAACRVLEEGKSEAAIESNRNCMTDAPTLVLGVYVSKCLHM